MDTAFLQRRVKCVASWRFWAANLWRALIGGAATAVIAKFALPNTIIDFEDLWKLAASAALVKGAMFLEKSPLPSVYERENLPTTAAPDH